jgi:hypothetical protein
MTRSYDMRQHPLGLITAVSLFASAVALAHPAAAHAQGPTRSQVVVIPGNAQEADETRRQFEEILRQYSPSVGGVLKLDPTLMSNGPYLESYPAVAAFLKQHPEIPRSPQYFLTSVRTANDQQREQPLDADAQVRMSAVRMWSEVMAGVLVCTGFIFFFFTVGGIVRAILSHRRWLRATKLQSEVHNRLLERFGANDELLAYVQSPAGSQFLQGSAVIIDAAPGAAMSAPYARILWSVQAGLVIGLAGIGILSIRNYMAPEVGPMFLTFGVLAAAIGLGFVLAAVASYVLSRRLGLMDRTADRASTSA